MSEEKQFLHIYGDPVVITDEDLRALKEKVALNLKKAHDEDLERRVEARLFPVPDKEGDTESRVKNEESLR